MNPHTNRFRPRLESLESRTVPTTVTFNHGVLTVVGTAGDDAIVVEQTGGRLEVEGERIRVRGRWRDGVSAGQVTAVRVRGLDGDDRIDLSDVARRCVVDAGNGADHVIGGSAADVIFGAAGDDDLFGGMGNDVCRGGDGDDLVRGDSGRDDCRGDDGDDDLSDDDNEDRLEGGDGRDRLRGGRERDEDDNDDNGVNGVDGNDDH